MLILHRARGLMPYTMEAFGYLMACGTLIVEEAGAIALNEPTVRRGVVGSQDTKDCQNVARSLGRKLAQVHDRVTIYTSLGIRP